MHVEYLAEELVKRGHEVHVLYSLDAYQIKKKHDQEKVSREGVHVYPIKTRFSLSAYEAYVLGNSSVVLRTFERLINQIKPNVVHHHNISLLGYGILKKRAGYANLYTAHDYWLICQQNNLLKYGSRVCNGGSCFLCALSRRRPPQLWRSSKKFKDTIEGELDGLIAPSNFLRRKILERFDVNTVTIPNFVPEPPSQIEPPNFSNYFLYAGVLERHKGVIDLLIVYKEIANKIDAKLIIVGDGSLKKTIADFIDKNKLGDSIILLGWRRHEEILSLLKSAKALIIPSICPENCPLIALEAISLGKPVIASNKGGLPEVINKIDRELIYNSTTELKQILMNFNIDKYPPWKIKNVHMENYSPQVYLRSYFKLIAS